MTVVAASAFAAFPGRPETVFAIIFIAGIFQVMLGLVKAGQMIRFMPYPVISGFMSGIGIIIILLQIQPLLGSAAAASPIDAIMGAGRAISRTDLHSVFLALLTLLIVYKIPARISRLIPSPLIALVTLTFLSWYMDLPVMRIGEMPTQFPSLHLPRFSPGDFRHIVALALTLSLLGAIDSLLTSLVFDSLTKERHNPKKELIGQGIGNMAAALIGGIPGAGATMRTVINIKSGALTRFSGVVHALFLLAVLLGLGRLTRFIPMAVLSGILIKVGIDILDYRFLKIMGKAPKQDFFIMAAVLLTTVFVDLIAAVVIGVILAAVFVTHRIASQMEVELTGIPVDRATLEREKALQEETDFHVRIINIRGAFFFGSATQIVDRVDRLIGTKVIVFNCLEVPFMDMSALFAMEEIILKLAASGIASFIIIREKDRSAFVDLGIEKSLGDMRIFMDYDKAIVAAQKYLENEN